MNFWRKSLMARLVSYYLLLSLVIVSLGGYVAFTLARDALKQSVFDRLNAIATHKETALNRWIEAQRREVRMIALLPGVRTQAELLLDESQPDQIHKEAYARLSEYFLTILSIQPDLQSISLLTDEGGQAVISTDKSLEGQYRVSDSYFMQGRQETYVQNVYPSPVTLRPTMTIATPLSSRTGQAVGVLAVHLNLERMSQIILERAGLGTTGETYLVDQFNVFVSGERFGREKFPRGVHTEGIDRAVAGVNGAGLYLNYEGVPVIGVYRWLDQWDLALLAEMHQEEALAPARQLAGTTLLVGLVSAGVLAIGVYWLARQIARPVMAIAETAILVAAGDLSRTAPVITGDEIGLLARTFNQMTAQIQALYQSLRQSEAYFRSLIENALDVITVLDSEARIRFTSPSVERVLGYKPEEVTGRSALDLVSPEDFSATFQAIQEILQHPEKTATALFRVRHQNGSWRYLEAIGRNLLDDPAVRGFVINSRDVTERMHLEDQLRQAHKMEAIGRLAGGIAHDFNNILTIISGITGLLLARLTRQDRLYEDIEQIKQAGERAAALTRQLLAFSRKQVLKPEVINLNTVIAHLEKLLRRLISEDIELVTIPDQDLGLVKADPGQIEQVILNLVVNARDAMPAGGRITLETTNVILDETYALHHVDARPGAFVLLQVNDTGSGIKPETQARIFEPFFTTKEQGHGTGLGLATVYGIISQSGGHITVESQPGQGATFKVYLPKVDAQAEAAEMIARFQADLSGGTETVLLVEDNDMVRELVRRVLLAHGYQVLEARHALEALNTYSQATVPIHLLLTDVILPGGLNGPGLAEQLLAYHPALRVIYISGYTNDSLMLDKLIPGLALLQKPFTPGDLLQTVRRVLDGEVESS